jgi:hypothetical protein
LPVSQNIGKFDLELGVGPQGARRCVAARQAP